MSLLIIVFTCQNNCIQRQTLGSALCAWSFDLGIPDILYDDLLEQRAKRVGRDSQYERLPESHDGPEIDTYIRQPCISTQYAILWRVWFDDAHGGRQVGVSLL